MFNLNRFKFEGLPLNLCRFAFQQVLDFFGQQCPRYSGVFIRQGNSGYLLMLPAAQVLQPLIPRVRLVVDRLQC